MQQLFYLSLSVFILGIVFSFLHLPGCNIMIIIGGSSLAAWSFFTAMEKRETSAEPQDKE